MADQGMTNVGCCVLCLETFEDSIILSTCGHTFCLNCTKQSGKNENTELECPMCQTKVRIPAGGLEEFPKNYSLSDMPESSAFVGTEEPVAVSPAQVIKLESYTCTQHTENELQLYCIECSKTICLECVDAEHSSHKLFTISKIAADARIQLQSDVERMEEKLSLTRQERNKIEEMKKKLPCLFAERESDIKKEHERIKSYLEEQKKALDVELMTLKLNLMKQLEIEKQDVEAEELSLISFTTHVKEMIDGMDERANFKVVESLKDLNSRSWELMQMGEKEAGICSVTDVTFNPKDFPNSSCFCGNDLQQLIGTILVEMKMPGPFCFAQSCTSSYFLQSQLPYFGARRRVRSPVSEARLLDVPSENALYVAGKKAEKSDGEKDDDNQCIICMDNITDKKELPCKHKFCRGCIDEYFSKGQPKCPICGKVFDTLGGDQPKGNMTSRRRVRFGTLRGDQPPRTMISQGGFTFGTLRGNQPPRTMTSQGGITFGNLRGDQPPGTMTSQGGLTFGNLRGDQPPGTMTSQSGITFGNLRGDHPPGTMTSQSGITFGNLRGDQPPGTMTSQSGFTFGNFRGDQPPGTMTSQGGFTFGNFRGDQLPRTMTSQGGFTFGNLRGDQPPRTMTSRENNRQHSSGFFNFGASETNCSFSHGRQGENHPNPGHPNRGTHQTAFLPAKREGRDVLGLLKRVFDDGFVLTMSFLMFAIAFLLLYVQRK